MASADINTAGDGPDYPYEDHDEELSTHCPSCERAVVLYSKGGNDYFGSCPSCEDPLVVRRKAGVRGR